MTMKAKSYNGLALNDNTNFVTEILSPTLGLVNVGVGTTPRYRKFPRFSSITRGPRQFILNIWIRSDVSNNRDSLYDKFDYETEATAKFVVTDEDGSSNPRQVDAICIGLMEIPNTGANGYQATLVVDGDICWRKTTITTETTWNPTSSGATTSVTNSGTKNAYPIFTVTPQLAKSGGNFQRKRFFPIVWNASTGAEKYPIDITGGGWDTATIVTAGDMQADGDDLWLYVDDVLVDRWLADMNGASTKIWGNFTFVKPNSYTLNGAITDVATDPIAVNEAIADTQPSEGIIYIGTEAITYTSLDKPNKQFGGTITRGAHGTTAAAHSGNDAVKWLQHKVELFYKDSLAAAPTVDDNNKPAFNLSTSTNFSHVYADFGENDGKRSASWSSEVIKRDPSFYNGNRGAQADPWVEVGVLCTGNRNGDVEGAWRLYNPCGITNVNFSNGETYSEAKDKYDGEVESSKDGNKWSEEYEIPSPASNSTWDTWSYNAAITSGSKYVRMYLEVDRSGGSNEGKLHYLEAADCTVTIDSGATGGPSASVGAEITSYTMDMELWNDTTNEGISVKFGMDIGESIKVDLDTLAVTYLFDNTSHFESLDQVDGPRDDYMTLAPGANTIRIVEVGLVDVDVVIEYYERTVT